MRKYTFDDFDEEEEDLRFERDFFGRNKSKGYTYGTDHRRFSRFSDKFSSMSESFFGDSFNRKKNPLGPVLNIAKTMLKMVGSKSDANGNFTYKSKLTTGRTDVNLPMEIIMDMEKSKKEDKPVYDLDPTKVDSFLGGTLENASLKRYQTSSEYNRTIEDRDAKKVNAHRYIRNLLNTERVDKEMAYDYPGYNRFIQTYKTESFKDYKAPEEDPDNPGAHLLDVATRLIRFPSSITEEELKKYEKEITEFKKIFTKYGEELPETFEECDNLAKDVAQYIYLKEQEQDSNSGGGGKDSGEGKSKADQAAKALSKSIFGNENEELAAKAISDMGDAERESAAEDAEKNIQYDENAINLDSKVFYTEVKDDKLSYNSVLEKIDMGKTSALRQLFKRKSRDQKFIMKGMKSGRFDTNKLAEAAQHVPTVYERIGEVKTDKIAVGLLIDESGSMGGSSIKMAQQAAIMLNEIFKGQPDIEFFVYGHTADRNRENDTEILIYREPGKMFHKYALGNVYAKANNRDGHAILATALRIRRFTKNPAILMVLSDGAPAASGYYNGVNDTKEKVKKAEKMGFQIIQIAINNHVPSDKMFTHFVQMVDINSLPKDLSVYMSKKVNTLIKEHVSL